MLRKGYRSLFIRSWCNARVLRSL